MSGPLRREKGGGAGREGGRERETQSGSSAVDQHLGVWRAWKIMNCISLLAPDTCSCEGCYLLWNC